MNDLISVQKKVMQKRQSIRLLLVEDDTITNRVLTNFLNRSNFLVVHAHSIGEVLDLLEKGDINTVILNIKSPEMKGIEFLSKIREIHDLPVIVITDMTKNEDIERTFLSGADDYIIKPFTPQQLLDRIDRVIQITTPIIDTAEYVNGDIQLTPGSRQVRVGEKIGDLSLIETRLLQYFMDHPNILLSFDDLLKVGWSQSGRKNDQDYEMLRLAINHLRKKIEPDVNNPRYLPLVSADGYVFRPNE